VCGGAAALTSSYMLKKPKRALKTPVTSRFIELTMQHAIMKNEVLF
jgi:hypothetical protein